MRNYRLLIAKNGLKASVFCWARVIILLSIMGYPALRFTSPRHVQAYGRTPVHGVARARYNLVQAGHGDVDGAEKEIRHLSNRQFVKPINN